MTEFDNSLDDTSLNIFQRIPEIDILIVKDLQSFFFLQASNDSGRGPSMTELSTPNTSPHHQVYHCNFPTAICGRLIGKQGKNINFIKEKSGANITLSANPFTPEFQLCSIEGTLLHVVF